MSVITLLSATTPLTKKFTKTADSIVTEPYPLIRNVTSLEYDYDSLSRLHQIIAAGAGTGCCILKGKLPRLLSDESRQGLNDPLATTDLLVLDYDYSDGFESPEELLAAIDPTLETVSYIWQTSASAGIRYKSAIRGHAFIRLAAPLAPEAIKEWLTKINLTVEPLRQRTSLSRNGMSLKFPLDITVNQNDKLIYIAPPTCVGFPDPLTQEDRLQLHRRDQELYLLQPNFSAQQNREMYQERLEQLQEAAGLKKRAPKYATHKGVEVLTNPARCTISSFRDCGDFVRCNLNGGDSFAYWYRKDDPEILWNFKGEPPVRLKDVDPAFYAQQIQRPQVPETRTPVVFRDRVTDTYYNGFIDLTNRKVLEMHRASSKEKLGDFMRQFGATPPDPIEDWTVDFDPTIAENLIPEKRWINLFKPTPFMQMKPKNTAVPPTIDRILRHLTVDPEVYDHFINWLAFLLQTRERTCTGWLFSGTEGTGKGALYKAILKPLLGANHCHQVSNDQLDDEFNGYMENCLLLWLDEGDVKACKKTERVMAKLRNYITEETIPVRQMRATAVDRRNFSNLIVATNDGAALKIKAGDRRWNIAPRQETPIDLYDDFDKVEAELPQFAQFLLAYKADEKLARKPIHTEERANLIEMSMDAAQAFLHHLKLGDLEYFTDYLRDNPPMPSNGYYEFETAIGRWIEDAKIGDPTRATIDDLKSVYGYLTGKHNMTAKNFGWLLRTNGIQTQRGSVNGERHRFVPIWFKHNEEIRLPDRKTATVIPFEEKKKDVK